MIKIYDKAQWHIDAGSDAGMVIEKMKILFDFLDSKGMLTDEGKEMIDIGIDASISVHERMLTKKGNEFMEKEYDGVIGKPAGEFAAELEKAYKSRY